MGQTASVPYTVRMRHRFPLRAVTTAFALALFAASPALADEYTVDTFVGGYQAPGGSSTQVIGPNEDDTTAGITLPFAFSYFGRVFDRASVCSNGWVAFGSSSATTSVNPALPATAVPNAVLAPLWDDLATAAGSVRSFVEGSAPTRVFVIDWDSVESFDGSATGLSFQVRLHEDSGVVEFAYAAGGAYTSLSYTASLEDPSGTIAFSAAGSGNSQSGAPAADARFTPREVVVTGRVLRDRPVADETGLGNSTELGLAVEGATVRLVREDTGDVSATAITAADGSFALRGLGIDAPTTLAVDLLTTGDGARVASSGGSEYSHRIAATIAAAASTVLSDVTLDDAVDADDPPFRRALNVHQALERGYRVARAAAIVAGQASPPKSAEFIPRLTATWSIGATPAGGTAYAPVAGVSGATLFVSDATANPDAYDDDVLLREYALHVLATISVSPGAVPLPRGFSVGTTTEFAWAQGFGFWFACSVQERDVFIDTTSASTAMVFDLEAPPTGVLVETFPAAVAGSLWDLVDPADEVTDEFPGTTGPSPSTFQDIFTTIDRQLDAVPEGGSAFTIRDFFTSFGDAGTPEGATARRQMARAFIHLGTLPDDGAEPDDRIDEATLGGAPGVKLLGRRISPDNSDVLRLDVAGPDPQTVVIALTQTTDVDLSLLLLGASGGLIDFATNVDEIGDARATLRVEPSAPLPPGTYFVRVDAGTGNGVTGDYAVSIFNPLVVGGVDALEWTEGVPLKEDFPAKGGISPFTYTTSTGGAPGLVLAEDGSRITGTPTQAGEFTIDVAVADDAAPINRVARMVPFVINPALAIRPFFAVAAERTISRVLGTGGTDPEWTPELQPGGDLLLVGGARLTLTGATGAPRTFGMAARADDAVGAMLPLAPVQVVVTRDFFDADGATIPVAGPFGYYLDALKGSEISVVLRFKGTGERPEVIGFIDDAGTPLLGESTVVTSGRKLKFSGPLLRATGRYHMLLDPKGFVGTVDVKVEVTPPRKAQGEHAIQPADTVVEVPVDVLAGATVKIVLRRSQAPSSLEPTVSEIEGPDGNLLALPTERRRRRGREAVLVFEAPASGRYLLRFTGRDGTSGPLFYKVRVRTPRKARLVLD